MTTPDAQTTAQVAHAQILAHSDTYLLELVERWEICPFARRCREEGRLWRKVSWADEDRLGQHMDQAIDALEAKASEGDPEVALLLCPNVQHLPPQRFNDIYVASRDRYRLRHPKQAFYVVAFHPDLKLNVETAGGLIPFWRRSPHPTLQFVSVPLLQRLRHVDRGRDPNRIALELAATGAAPEEIAAALAELRPHQPVSERVAEHNAETYASQGAAPFLAIQRDLNERVQVDTATFGPWQTSWPDGPWLPTSAQKAKSPSPSAEA
ncbi:MAG: DUF1415 family protein [Myxococcales bacterium]|nr:DUF1415 family protein [Myxococcales bacterium]